MNSAIYLLVAGLFLALLLIHVIPSFRGPRNPVVRPDWWIDEWDKD